MMIKPLLKTAFFLTSLAAASVFGAHNILMADSDVTKLGAGRVILEPSALKAVAKSYEGPYTLVNSNLWPAARLEDFFIFKNGGKYHLICEDAEGNLAGHDKKWGGHSISDDGINRWRRTPQSIAYDDTIRWSDGTEFKPVRRERPWLLIEGGKITHLFNAVFDGKRTWNQPVPLMRPIDLN